MEMLEAFGIDYRLLIANFINFGLLLLILYKVGYKPIMKFIAERTAAIETGIKNAERATSALAEAEATQASLLAKARQDAQQLVAEAQQRAEQQGAAIVERSKSEAHKVIEQAKQDIRGQHDQMMREAKQELAGVVILATEKILQAKMDTATDEALLKKVLSDTAK